MPVAALWDVREVAEVLGCRHSHMLLPSLPITVLPMALDVLLLIVICSKQHSDKLIPQEGPYTNRSPNAIMSRTAEKSSGRTYELCVG